MNETPGVSIVFSTFNGERTLPAMLEQLRTVKPPTNGFELIAVDNGSTDNTHTILRSFTGDLPLRILEQPVRGKNRALNIAIPHAKGQLVVFTDDDILPDDEWLVSFQRCATEHPEVDIFGGSIAPHWESDPADWLLNGIPLGVTYGLTSESLADGPIFPGLIWGANMMLRRRVLDAGHRFNEDVGPSAGQYIMGSETEFNIRISKLGYRSWFCKAAKVSHIIRDYQMTKHWAIRRAYRFGRNQCLQDYVNKRIGAKPFLNIINFPKWMLRRVARDSFTGYINWLFGNERESAIQLWDASFYRGYISQAQKLGK